MNDGNSPYNEQPPLAGGDNARCR